MDVGVVDGLRIEGTREFRLRAGRQGWRYMYIHISSKLTNSVQTIWIDLLVDTLRGYALWVNMESYPARINLLYVQMSKEEKVVSEESRPDYPEVSL